MHEMRGVGEIIPRIAADDGTSLALEHYLTFDV